MVSVLPPEPFSPVSTSCRPRRGSPGRQIDVKAQHLVARHQPVGALAVHFVIEYDPLSIKTENTAGDVQAVAETDLTLIGDMRLADKHRTAASRAVRFAQRRRAAA